MNLIDCVVCFLGIILWINFLLLLLNECVEEEPHIFFVLLLELYITLTEDWGGVAIKMLDVNGESCE